MAIGVRRDMVLRVAQHDLNHLHRDSLHEQESRCGVAQIMKSDRAKFSAAEVPLELARNHVPRHRPAQLAREDQAPRIADPRLSRTELGRQLAGLEPTQRRDDWWGNH